MYKCAASLTLVALAAGISGCVGAEKSSNPLSPTVAGPIPGVAISAPSPVQPVGTRITSDQQPVTLMVGNATTNGVRPLTYSFDIATDVNFTNKVFTRAGVTPDASGQTSLKLPDPLATGHTYYWRAQALDGANSSSYSATASFDVYTPVVIQAPVLVSPVNNVTTDSLTPVLTLTDAVHTGPAGAITYVIEVATSDTFANKLAVWTLAETPNQSALAVPGSLPASTQVFWHARASDPNTTGPFSATAVFTTPAPAAPPSTGGGGTGGGGSSVNPPVNTADQISLASANITHGPSDVSTYTVTTSVSNITFDPSAGVNVTFSAENFWPDQPIPALGGGTIQYTVWACTPQGGWTCAAFIEMWKGRGFTGAPLPSQYINWWGGAGGATAGVFGSYVPQPGDTMAFFVVAGDQRAGGGYTTVRERSNVVLVTLPSGDSGSFSY